MKTKIIAILFIISVSIHLYDWGKWLLIDQGYTPSAEEQIILNEMIQKTVESEDYKAIQEKVIAIESGIDKHKGGVYPYYFYISVLTEKQTYLFSCSNKQCDTMDNGAWTYSIYQDEQPRLPFSE